MKLTPVSLCLAVATSVPVAVWAQAPPITLQSIATGLPSVVAITHAGDGSGRLFITLQDGRVRVHDGCVLHVMPFLDIDALVLSGGERGLLSVAFHPNYPATPYFFVNYTRNGDGATVIARYRVSSGNPNLADPTSGVTLLVIAQPFSNHNGGQLQFGPDGYLYIGMGDGGSANDPACRAQRNDTLLGKMLRIDVDQNVNTPPYYGIPPTNPFVGPGDPPDEIWAKGLRNPWRFSFDRLTGDLFIGDVGQSAREEVDFQPAGVAGGQNWGWKIKEGTVCTGNTGGCTSPPSCADPSLLPPILEYDHGVGCSITGGYRYRGSQVAGLAGYYIYADYCSGEIFAASESGGVWSAATLSNQPFSISTFGEDEAGELYVAEHAGSGAVYRIFGASPQANLSITKTDGLTTVFPGQPITYTINVGNAGPYRVSNATVLDTFPSSLQNVNWSCSATAGSSCCTVTGGNVSINNRPVMVLPGGTVTFTATATVSPSATGTISNTATVTAPAGLPDPSGGNNSATDVDTVVVTADLSITKTDGQTTALSGTTVTYTIVVTNGGPNSVTGATVSDSFPAQVTSVSWSCSASAGSSCGAPSGSGNINQPVNLLSGGTATFTAAASLSTTASGTLSNTATVAAPGGVTDPNGSNNSATDTDSILTQTDLSVTKTDGEATAAPGQLRTYSIVVSNGGPNPATGATVTDNVPASLTGATWTCAGASGGMCTAGPVAGNINDSVNLPVGGSVTYTLSGTVATNPTGLTNTATVSVPPGMLDSNPGNNSATDDDILLCVSQVFLVPDGRVTTRTIGAATTQWFAASLKIGNSYSLEFKNATGANTPPGTLTVFSGDDGCSGTSTVNESDSSGIDPGTGAGAARLSFAAEGSGTFFRASLQNTSGSPVDYTFSLSDTTMFSPAWSTNGAFNTYYSFQNTTGATLNATLTLRDTAGTLLMTFGMAIPAGQTTTVNTAGLGVTRNRTGTAKLVHDGPPGAVNAEAAIANFSTNPAYVQPVKVEAVRQSTH